MSDKNYVIINFFSCLLITVWLGLKKDKNSWKKKKGTIDQDGVVFYIGIYVLCLAWRCDGFSLNV